jgi:hypothetical protein
VDGQSDYFKKNIEKGIKELTGDNSFELSKDDNIHVGYEICRNYVMEKANRAGIIRKEQAYGEMSRGIIFVSVISIIWIIIKQFFVKTPIQNFWYVFGFIVFCLICFSYRYIQARRVAPVFIFSLFCSLVNEKDDYKVNIEKQ